MQEQKSAGYGFVYVLGNYSMPGLFKIGATTRSPSQRTNELSSATSCPEEFSLLFYAEVEQPFVVESAVHQWLEGLRLNKKREFFSLTEDQLLEVESFISDFSLTFCMCEMRSYCYVMYPLKQKAINHFLDSGYADIFEYSKYEDGI